MGRCYSAPAATFAGAISLRSRSKRAAIERELDRIQAELQATIFRLVSELGAAADPQLL